MATYAHEGRTLADRFDLVYPTESQLPYAGASTWIARDTVLSRKVRAIVLDPESERTPHVIDAARRTALIENPGVAAIVSVISDGRDDAIITEVPPGRPLAEYISGTAKNPTAIWSIMGEVSSIVNAVRHRGVRHLQLRAADIFIQDSGAIVVDGFGVHAALAGADTTRSAIDLDHDEARGLTVLFSSLLLGHDFPDDPALHDDVVRRASERSDLPTVVREMFLQEVNGNGAQSPSELMRRLAPWPELDIRLLGTPNPASAETQVIPTLHRDKASVEPLATETAVVAPLASDTGVLSPIGQASRIDTGEKPDGSERESGRTAAAGALTAAVVAGAVPTSSAGTGERDADTGSSEPAASAEAAAAHVDSVLGITSNANAKLVSGPKWPALLGTEPQAELSSVPESAKVSSGEPASDGPKAGMPEVVAPAATNAAHAAPIDASTSAHTDSSTVTPTDSSIAAHTDSSSAAHTESSTAKPASDEAPTVVAPSAAVPPTRTSVTRRSIAERVGEPSTTGETTTAPGVVPTDPPPVFPESILTDVIGGDAVNIGPGESGPANTDAVGTANVGPKAVGTGSGNADSEFGRAEAARAESGHAEAVSTEPVNSDPDVPAPTERIGPRRTSVIQHASEAEIEAATATSQAIRDSGITNPSGERRNPTDSGASARTTGSRSTGSRSTGSRSTGTTGSGTSANQASTGGAKSTRTTGEGSSGVRQTPTGQSQRATGQGENTKGQSQTGTRRSENTSTSRVVVTIFAVLVAVAAIISLAMLFRPTSAVNVNSEGGFLPMTTAPTDAQSSASPSASPTPTTAAEPAIAGIQLLNPDAGMISGTDPATQDNPSQVGLAIDNNAATAWDTWNYFEPAMRPMSGIGLLIELEEPATVSEVTLNVNGQGGNIQWRDTVSQAPGSGKLIAESAMSGEFTLTADEPLETDHVILWITEQPVADSDGKYRTSISEITVK